MLELVAAKASARVPRLQHTILHLGIRICDDHSCPRLSHTKCIQMFSNGRFGVGRILADLDTCIARICTRTLLVRGSIPRDTNTHRRRFDASSPPSWTAHGELRIVDAWYSCSRNKMWKIMSTPE